MLFIHHIWGETVPLITQTSDRMQYFTTFQDKLHSVNIQDDQSCLAKPFKKFPKSPMRPAGSHFWRAPNLQWTLIELRFNIIKNYFFFLFKGFITMRNLKKRLIRAAFCTSASDVHERLKTNDTAIIKIVRETTNNQ